MDFLLKFSSINDIFPSLTLNKPRTLWLWDSRLLKCCIYRYYSIFLSNFLHFYVVYVVSIWYNDIGGIQDEVVL